VRAAAIFGPGCSAKDLKSFQQNSGELAYRSARNSDQADAILIFGGDGTVHRYLPQLVELRIPVLVVHCGSGNDFAPALGLRNSRDSLAVWHKFCSGSRNVRPIDLGVVTTSIVG
jgi:diacylglycerol kinase (ATP)